MRLGPIILLGLGLVSAQAAQPIPADGRAITPQLAQQVADIVRGAYSINTPIDDAFFQPGSNYVSLAGLVAADPGTDFGFSQRMVVYSLFAVGASIENTAFQGVMNLFKGLAPTRDAAINDTPSGSSNAGILAGYVMVPILVRAFCTMDIFLTEFFSWRIYFALLLFMVVMMGAALLRQMHEGKLDLVGWIGRAVFAIICMVKANMLCNLIMAALFGLAATINCSIIHGVTSQTGIDQWYLKVFGPQLTRNCYAIVGSKAGIAKAFSESQDMNHIPRYVFYENGRQTAVILSKYLGGAEGYNQANGANTEIAGVSLKEAAAMYCLMVVYNVGRQNLQGHENLGFADVPADLESFRLAITQLYTGNEGLTVGDTSDIDQACQALTINGGPTEWQYLADNTTNPQAPRLSAAYREPPTLALSQLANVTRNRATGGTSGSLWSSIMGTLLTLWEKAGKAFNFVSWLPASIGTMITQGALQQLMLAGLIVWMLLAVALCKIGVIMVVLTSPFVMIENTGKMFWSAVKTMIYPAIYPAMLILIFQITAALASWMGTVSGLTMGIGMVLNMVPLLFGLVALIMLPKLVKVMLTGGNVLIAQLSGTVQAAGLAVAAAVGGAGLAAAGAAAKGAGAAAATASSGSGVTGDGGGGGSGGGGVSSTSGPIGRAVQGVGRAVRGVGKSFGQIMKTPVPGTNLSVGKAGFSSLVGGIPLLIARAIRSAHKPKA